MYCNISTKDIKTETKTKVYDDDLYKVFWEGFLFLKGLAPGEESLKELIKKLKEESIENIVEDLSGTFACIIQNKKTNIIHIFIDNSGLFDLFNSPKFISSSFLNIVQLNNLGIKDINPTRYSDFVAANSFMRWETYFDNITRFRYDDIIKIDGSNVSIIKKNMVDLFSIKKFDKTIMEQYTLLAESLKKFKGRISCDLTGGCDTRMNCVNFKKNGIEFETAISGMPGNLDVEYSKLVAQILGTEHYIHYHTVNDNSLLKEIEECFNTFGPLLDSVIYHRYLQYQKEKLSRKCEVTITGHAGELYKAEFIWNLDNDNPQRAIQQMLDWGANIRYGTALRTIPHDLYTEQYKKYSLEYANRLKEFLLSNFSDDKSGKVGPKMYAQFHEASRSSNFGAVVDRFSPLLDRNLIPCGITLKTTTRTLKGKFKRFLTQPWDDRDVFESRVITSINKKVAKVKITNRFGFNASTKRVDRIKKMYKIIKGSVFKPNLNFVSALHPEFYPAIRSLNKTQEMIEILKNKGILAKSVKVDQISNDYLGSFFTIGRFLEYCDNL